MLRQTQQSTHDRCRQCQSPPEHEATLYLARSIKLKQADSSKFYPSACGWLLPYVTEIGSTCFPASRTPWLRRNGRTAWQCGCKLLLSGALQRTQKAPSCELVHGCCEAYEGAGMHTKHSACMAGTPTSAQIPCLHQLLLQHLARQTCRLTTRQHPCHPISCSPMCCGTTDGASSGDSRGV